MFAIFAVAFAAPEPEAKADPQVVVSAPVVASYPYAYSAYSAYPYAAAYSAYPYAYSAYPYAAAPAVLLKK